MLPAFRPSSQVYKDVSSKAGNLTKWRQKCDLVAQLAAVIADHRKKVRTQPTKIDAHSHATKRSGQRRFQRPTSFYAVVGRFPVFTQGVCVLWEGKRALLPSLFLAFEEERGFGLIRLFRCFWFHRSSEQSLSPRRSVLRTPPVSTVVLHQWFG